MSGSLENKIAIIHGGAGAIGAEVARAFARAGSRLFLAGRTLGRVEAVAAELRAAGGRAEAAAVDALDPAAVNAHADDVAARAGGIDIVLNAVGIDHVQGPRFAELGVDDFALPIIAYTRTHFITAQAAARHMAPRRRGVILTVSTPGSRLTGPGYMGYGVACAAVEAMTRHLAGELGASGVRAICLRCDALPEAVARGSHAGRVFAQQAALAGTTVEAMLAEYARAHLLQRLPALAEVAAAAAFLSSDGAGAMTGAIANLTCGSVVD
jgi:NAD(P)-dependent dehydrogenase (short-subunit alcohol dehydrogenase family)